MQFAGSHILSISQFERAEVEQLFLSPMPCGLMRTGSAEPAS